VKPIRAEDWAWMNDDGKLCLPRRGAHLRAYLHEHPDPSVKPDEVRTTSPIDRHENGVFYSSSGTPYELGSINKSYAEVADKRDFNGTAAEAGRLVDESAAQPPRPGQTVRKTADTPTLKPSLSDTDPGRPSPIAAEEEVGFVLADPSPGAPAARPGASGPATRGKTLKTFGAGASTDKPKTAARGGPPDIMALAAEDADVSQGGEVVEPWRVTKKKKKKGGDILSLRLWPWNWFKGASDQPKTPKPKTTASGKGAATVNTVAPAKVAAPAKATKTGARTPVKN